jgi:hypothetical protein
MSSRSRSIVIRGWIVIAAAFVALALPIALNALGFANYDSERDGSDPYRPADRGLGERICLVLETMIPACLLIGPAALLRARHAGPFEGEEKGGRVVPLTSGACGLALFVWQWVRCGPYTGEHFAMFQGWQFAVAWLLVWWCFAFVHFGAPRTGSAILHPADGNPNQL